MQQLTPYQQIIREAGDAFMRLCQTYQFCTQRTLRKYGLYPGQPAILFAISKAQQEGAKPTQNQLADALGITRASAGVSLRRMEKAGFVKREADPYDTRCNRIVLTKKGAEFAHWCEMDVEMIFTNMMEDFEADERGRAVETLRRMQKGMAAMRARFES